MSVFSGGLGESIAQRFDDNCGVIVARLLKGFGENVHFFARGAGESTEVVLVGRGFWRNIVCEAELSSGILLGGAFLLTPKATKGGENSISRFVAVYFDVVADGVSGPDADRCPAEKKVFV